MEGLDRIKKTIIHLISPVNGLIVKNPVSKKQKFKHHPPTPPQGRALRQF